MTHASSWCWWLLMVCVAGVSLASDVSFTAHLEVEDDPRSPDVTLKGTFMYKYDGVAYKNHYTRFDISSPTTATELRNYGTMIMYKHCSKSCDSEPFTDSIERLFILKTDHNDPSQQPDGDGCLSYTRSGDPAGIIELRSRPADGALCSVSFLSGKRYKVSSYSAGVESAKLTEWTQWSCPAASCIIDLVLVVDESGSITADNYTHQMLFCNDILNRFNVGPEGSSVGMVGFSDSSRVIFNMTTDAMAAIDVILKNKQVTGGTCIGCGLTKAIELFKKQAALLPGREKMNATKMIILMTDGGNTIGTYAEAVKQAQALGVYRIAIGTGTGISMGDLKAIASSIPGVSTVLLASNFSALPTVISQAVPQSCQSIPVQTCGSGCHGYCSCGGKCISPSKWWIALIVFAVLAVIEACVLLLVIGLLLARKARQDRMDGGEGVTGGMTGQYSKVIDTSDVTHYTAAANYLMVGGVGRSVKKGNPTSLKPDQQDDQFDVSSINNRQSSPQSPISTWFHNFFKSIARCFKKLFPCL